MEWRGRRGSTNARYRGRRTGGAVRAGGAGGLGLVAVVVIAWFLGVDITPLLQDPGAGGPASTAEPTEADLERAEFVAVTLAYTEEVWDAVFRDQLGAQYRPVRLESFTGGLDSACGYAGTATGPFYCPRDQRIYIDTDFLVTLDRQLGAKGDFAAAYVVAHEVAHHIQDQTGILAEVSAARQRADAATANALSVRLELQADCLAGVWARQARDRLGVGEPGDFEEAVAAAGRIGDDVLQRSTGRAVRPESFTHGTAAQRRHWFSAGLDTGRIDSCDTFAAGAP